MSSLTSTLVHLAASFGPILTGESISGCESTFLNGSSCGAATPAINAYWRNLTEPSLLIPRLDLYSPFVQMHPDGWNVNRQVLVERFGYNVVTAPSSLMTNADRDDVDLLQSSSLSLLLTNVVLSPTNSWHPYVEAVHFDEETGFAVMFLVPDSTSITADPSAAALATLDFIAKRSEEDGIQWMTVIYYDFINAPIEAFIEDLVSHQHPPSLLLDVNGNLPSNINTPTLINDTMWICSYEEDDELLHRFEVELATNELSFRSIINVTFVEENLEQIPVELQDDQFREDVQYLQALATQAFENNPIVGYSGTVPVTRDGRLRLCFGGECALGNLFTDALRWHAKADVGFIASGGVRGPGWDAGPVTVSDVWGANPFPNQVCTGSMLGLHLFELLNYSTAEATFTSTYTQAGDQLLQVSGMRYTYNTEININETSTSRLIGVEVYDETAQEYKPVERTKIYTFATGSYLCGHRTWEPRLVSGLTLKGEVPGTFNTDEETQQGVVQLYLAQLAEPYDTTLMGRLENDTLALEPLDFLQTAEKCAEQKGTTWSEETQTCVTCPNQGEKVRFSEPSLNFLLELGSTEVQDEAVVELINLESFPVMVTPKVIPAWMELENSTQGRLLQSGEGTNMTITVTSPSLGAGTASGTLSLGVVDGGNFPGCTGGDVVLDVVVQTLPAENLNQLGNLRYVGFTLCAIAFLTAVFFGVWVYLHRANRVVKTLQPPFLMKLCVGIVIIAGSLATLSIDDQIVSAEQASIACMATPWLVGLGTAVAFSALFSKLWRINRLFNAQFRRVQVREKDVMWPFWVLLSVNIVFLLTWTFVDPLTWQRQSISGQPWNSYGQCSGEGAVSDAMLGCVIMVAAAGLIMACWQAWRARSISTEFSEAKYIGIAVFCWLQLLCVGGPVLFLINEEDTTTLYFVVEAILFIICMTMLGFIFAPLIIHKRAEAKTPGNRRSVQVTGFTVGVQNNSNEEVMDRARTCIDGTDTRTDVENPSSETQALKEELATLQASMSQLQHEKEALGADNEKLKDLVKRTSASDEFHLSMSDDGMEEGLEESRKALAEPAFKLSMSDDGSVEPEESRKAIAEPED